MTEPVDWDDMENTKDRVNNHVNGEVVKKFEENGEKIIRCDIIAQDAWAAKSSRDFYCGPALISFLYQVAFKN